jgi:hypothetical protein
MPNVPVVICDSFEAPGKAVLFDQPSPAFAPLKLASDCLPRW